MLFGQWVYCQLRKKENPILHICQNNIESNSRSKSNYISHILKKQISIYLPYKKSIPKMKLSLVQDAKYTGTKKLEVYITALMK